MTSYTASPEYKRAYYRKNIGKWKQYKIGWNLANPEKVLFQSAKGRAKKSGIEFSIVLSNVVIPKFCPVLGIRLELNGQVGGRRDPHWNAPSLDRIDPAKGYIPGNVRVISWRANSLKRDGTLEEMRLVLADLERQDR